MSASHNYFKSIGLHLFSRAKSSVILLLTFFIALECHSDIYLVFDSTSALQLQYVEKLERGFSPFLAHRQVIRSSASKLKKNCNQAENLVITLGERSILDSYSKCPQASHLATFISKESYNEIFVKHLRQERQVFGFGAVVIDQPFSLACKKARELLGEQSLRRPVVLVSSGRKRVVIDEMPLAYRKNVQVVEISEGQDLVQLAKHYFNQASSVMAYPDKKVWSPSNAKWLLYIAYQNRVPVIGYSAAFLNAGSVLSVYSTTDQMIETTLDSVRKWLTKDGSWRQIRHPLRHTFKVNESIYRAFGMPPSVLTNPRGK